MPYLLTLLSLGFMLYCVLDIVLSSRASVRGLPKRAWLVVVVLVPVLGGLAWLLGGRPETHGLAPGRPVDAPGAHAGGLGRRRAGAAERHSVQRPRGPDDDPDFLRQLDERLRRHDEDEQ